MKASQINQFNPFVVRTYVALHVSMGSMVGTPKTHNTHRTIQFDGPKSLSTYFTCKRNKLKSSSEIFQNAWQLGYLMPYEVSFMDCKIRIHWIHLSCKLDYVFLIHHLRQASNWFKPNIIILYNMTCYSEVINICISIFSWNHEWIGTVHNTIRFDSRYEKDHFDFLFNSRFDNFSKNTL